MRAIAVKVASASPVATLAPAPTNAFEPTESVVVALAWVPSARSWTFRNSASATGIEVASAVAVTPPPVAVTDVGEPLPASVPTNAATRVVSVECRFARPTPTPKPNFFRSFVAVGVVVAVAESVRESAITVAPSPTDARTLPAVPAFRFSTVTVTRKPTSMFSAFASAPSVGATAVKTAAPLVER